MAINTTNIVWPTNWYDGLVIQDANGNEFVWVPVDGTNVAYAKWCTTGTVNTVTTNDSIKSGSITEATQITNNKGFYIARYEAGNSSGIVSKKAATVWNNISYTNAKIAAEAMYTTTSVNSGLVTGTQWDTTMKWISNNSGPSVTLSKTWGNYGDSASPANVGSGVLHTTGYSENWKSKNIYDLAGNLTELTNEIWPTGPMGVNYVERGGSYSSSFLNSAAAFRCGIINNPITNTSLGMGFRVVLYIL